MVSRLTLSDGMTATSPGEQRAAFATTIYTFAVDGRIGARRAQRDGVFMDRHRLEYVYGCSRCWVDELFGDACSALAHLDETRVLDNDPSHANLRSDRLMGLSARARGTGAARTLAGSVRTDHTHYMRSRRSGRD
jgi:hypothetical protein